MHIDSELADRHTKQYPLGAKLAEGKTKTIYSVKNNKALCIVVAKDDITAGDGAKHDVIPGKGIWATETTCSVFEALAAARIPVAYVERDNVNSFIAPLCTMLPFEVVVRREAHGSYLKRHLNARKGDRFKFLKVEFFLKTSGKEWKGHTLPCDDPLVVFDGWSEDIVLHNPSLPEGEGKPLCILSNDEVWNVLNQTTSTMRISSIRRRMSTIAVKVFEELERAWEREGASLVDLKVEFGVNTDDNLLLADVIDNDSWRVVKDGQYLDKQTYRDGGRLEKVAELYQLVAEMTGRFMTPSS